MAPRLWNPQLRSSRQRYLLTPPMNHGKEVAAGSASEDALAKLLAGLTYKNADGEAMSYVSHQPLDAARRKGIASAFPEVAEDGFACFLVSTTKDGSVKDFIVRVKEGHQPSHATVVMGSCQIMFEDLSPCDCIEYAFPEAPEEWRVAQLSQDALEQYRGMKFDSWQDMLKAPTCEAQFRRMLQIGMISQFYDPQLFPTPAALKSKYQVQDEKTGKMIDLPHPVNALRIWNATSRSYKAIDTQLTGAPSAAEADKWWSEFVKDLRSKHGEEYVKGLMGN